MSPSSRAAVRTVLSRLGTLTLPHNQAHIFRVNVAALNTNLWQGWVWLQRSGFPITFSVDLAKAKASCALVLVFPKHSGGETRLLTPLTPHTKRRRHATCRLGTRGARNARLPTTDIEQYIGLPLRCQGHVLVALRQLTPKHGNCACVRACVVWCVWWCVGCGVWCVVCGVRCAVCGAVVLKLTKTNTTILPKRHTQVKAYRLDYYITRYTARSCPCTIVRF